MTLKSATLRKNNNLILLKMNKINLHLNIQARIAFGNLKLSFSEDTGGSDESVYIPSQNFILGGFYTRVSAK